MNAIQEIKDENIRKVAMTLRSSGLAASETEAVRMAMMMSKTSQRVNQNFDEKQKSHVSQFPTQRASSAVSGNANSFFHTSSSVQEKPRMTGEKEEFIFGDVQEKESAQKKDVYKMDNEFEEVISQDLVSTKEMIKEAPKMAPVQEMKPVSSKPSMFGSGRASDAYAKLYSENAPKMNMPELRSEPAHLEMPHHEEHISAPMHSQQMPMQKPASNPSPVPVTAASSAQMAFASLLGSAQKTQEKHQEQKPAVQSSLAQASSSKPAEAAPVVQQNHQPMVQQSAPRPIMASIPDPRANMMKEANVDLSRMFNVNK